MHLKKLELYGFKSFADKVEIDFNPGITGVVGPNGSGKSNIGDAMRWVLGESSARSLRGTRMEDVIFNGALKRNPLGWCEVTLIFDNSSGALAIDFSEVAISRRVYRNGEGEYFINRSECRRKDIIELFRDTGIGREGYSIVGQGRIDEMLSHKPEERRDVFHEAAGIMKYRARRDEASRRLNTTRQNIQRLFDIMEEMERQLGPLKRQSNNARRYIEISKTLKELEINKFHRDYDKLKKNIDLVTKEIDKIEVMGRQETGTIEQNNNKLDEINATIEEFEHNIARIRNNIGQNMERINQHHGQELVLEERLTNHKQEQKRLLDEIEFDETRVVELKKETTELQSALDNKGDTSQKIKHDIDDIKSRIKSIAQEIDTRQHEIDEKKNIMMQELENMADIKSSTSRLEAMIEAYTTRKEELEESLSQAKRQKEINDDVRQEMQDIVDDLSGKISTLQSNANVQASKRNEYRFERSQLEKALQTKHDKSRNIKTRIQMLESLVNDYEGFSNPVRFLLSEDRSNDLIMGVVADIIDVPKDYVAAIERALGNAMQHIVTQSDYEAKELIRILRQNRAGRATFLPVDNIRGRYLKSHEQEVLDMRGCIGVAADLIDFDDEYEEIIYSLLGRTVICDNIDSATEIAKSIKHSCKFVTLKGDIVNPGGSLSGGSSGSKHSSLIGRRNQLEELQELYTVSKSDLEKAQTKLEDMNGQMTSQREQMDKDIADLNEARVVYAREKERFDKLQSSTKANDNKLQELKEQIDRISENISDAKKEIENMSTTSEDAKVKGSVSREEIGKAQAQVNNLRESHDEMNEHLEELMSVGADDEKERLKCSQRILWLGAEIERLISNVEQKKELYTNNEETSLEQQDYLSKSKESVGDEKEALDNLRKKLNQEMARQDEEKKKLTSMQELITTSQNRQLELVDKKHTEQVKLERFTLEMQNIQNRIWDYYELTYQGTLEFKNDEVDLTNADEDIAKMRRQIKAMGTVNVNAVQDYAELNERYTEHKSQHDDLIKAEKDLLDVIDGLNKQMREKFKKEFVILNEYFTENFTKLFGGGRAQLTLEDEDDVLNSGIIIEAQPPGKKLQMLSLLSGGEKALTAAAILFAMLKHRPSPFCLLDEIESALDDANLYHLADFLKEYSKDTQFVVITHRRPTMESCDVLYGVTMEERGVSKMISVKIADYQ